MSLVLVLGQSLKRGGLVGTTSGMLAATAGAVVLGAIHLIMMMMLVTLAVAMTMMMTSPLSPLIMIIINILTIN